MKTTTNFQYSPEVTYALQHGQPIVALETAVLTHGLPFPINIETSIAMEDEVRLAGAVPATIGLLDGKVHIGLNRDEVIRLGNPASKPRKVSRRDFGVCLVSGECGGTTVAGTLIAAQMAGIKVFATGGIGGVHRGEIFDVSADLEELSHCPIIVVCAGAKSILDLPATLEVLETRGVPVIGFQTSDFPAFFSRESGLAVNYRIETPAEAAIIAKKQWEMGINSSILVVNPLPADAAISNTEIEQTISKAIIAAQQSGIHGSRLTPFLLQWVNQTTQGKSMAANLVLLRNNATLAARIAVEVSSDAKPDRFI